jgi:hypothetical protein
MQATSFARVCEHNWSNMRITTTSTEHIVTHDTEKTKNRIARQTSVPNKKIRPNGSDPKIDIIPQPKNTDAHWKHHKGARNTTNEGATMSAVTIDGGCSNHDTGMSVATTEEVNPVPKIAEATQKWRAATSSWTLGERLSRTRA